MIIGSITVYSCDLPDCDAQKCISSDGLSAAKEGWFIGVYKHFCPAHRNDRDLVPGYVTRSAITREVHRVQ